MLWRTSAPPKLLWLGRILALSCTLVLLFLVASHRFEEELAAIECTYRGRRLKLPTEGLSQSSYSEASTAKQLLQHDSMANKVLHASIAIRTTSAAPALTSFAKPADSSEDSNDSTTDMRISPAAQPPQGQQGKRLQEPYLALCLAVKDQAEDLPHWVEYHARLGVGKFYIFDESESSSEELLANFMESGLVEYTHLTEPKGQLGIYATCLEHPKRYEHTFMGFIDADEYLVIRGAQPHDLPLLLSKYEGRGVGGLAVNWRLFGSSGHLLKPQGPPTENFWRCLPAEDRQNWQIKSLVNTRAVTAVGRDPHSFLYQPGISAVNTLGERVEQALTDNYVDDSLVLFHYVTKSLEDFQAKMARGSGMGNHRKIGFFDEMDRLAIDDCTDLIFADLMTARI